MVRNLPITLTFPEDFLRDLHSYVPKRQLSRFFYELGQKELEHKKQELAQAFREAAEDENLNEEFNVWDTCVGDGIDETNEYKKR